MKDINANRNVWARSFSNSPQEPYKKKCNRCEEQIWMNPQGYKKWAALGVDGKPHKCAKTEKKLAKCKMCGADIRFKMVDGKIRPQTPKGHRHRCKK